MSDQPIPDDAIFPGDPRYDGFRIAEVWAFVAIDPRDDQEGFIADLDTGAALLGTDERRVREMYPAAERWSRAYGIPVRLVRFSGPVEFKTIE